MFGIGSLGSGFGRLGAPGRGAEEWSIEDVVKARWYDASTLSTLFQDNLGATPVTTTGQAVGYIADKSGNGRHISQSNGSNKGIYRGSTGFPSVQLDGASDVLFDTSPGLYAAGMCSVFCAVKANPAGSARLWAESSTVDADPVYGMHALAATPSTNAVLLRNDANTEVVSNASLQALAFNDAIRVVGFVDDGATITPYLNGVAGTPVAYTRSGVLTLDRFAIGALVRATVSSWMAVHIYEFIACYNVLSAAHCRRLSAYMGAKRGLAL